MRNLCLMIPCLLKIVFPQSDVLPWKNDNSQTLEDFVLLFASSDIGMQEKLLLIAVHMTRSRSENLQSKFIVY